MLKAILHRLVAIPQVYDLVQDLAGGRKVYKWLSKYTAEAHESQTFLDVGCGTGLTTRLLELKCRYVGLDIDAQKLEQFQQHPPERFAMVADGAKMPVPEQSVDIALVIFVVHHLTDDTFCQVLAELDRVVTDAGRIIIVDPLWDTRRWLSRMMWALDRGAYPRTSETLTRLLSDHFTVEHKGYLTIYHRYQLTVLRKKRSQHERLE
ncbi:MAG: methyltransferase domain-containing protein [Chloroflexota bacterium]|nr:methyltransferase domain-containing protein [Chloroflexota bacterium]